MKNNKYEIDMCNGTLMDQTDILFIAINVVWNPAASI